MSCLVYLLRKINKEHNITDTNSIPDQISLDHYYVKIGGTKLFNKDKVGGGTRGLATTNIIFDTVNPNISHSVPVGTKITGKEPSQVRVLVVQRHLT